MKITLNFYVIAVIVLFFSCGQKTEIKNACLQAEKQDSIQVENEKYKINNMLDSFNLAAANADYDLYFSYYAGDAVFMGTDATENWSKDSFMVWAKPYFDNGRAWDFKSLERNIYFDKTGKVAWFDELLDTQMKICRGSGVLTKQGDVWKIQQYVLSMTIPNSIVKPVSELKADDEDEIIDSLKKTK